MLVFWAAEKPVLIGGATFETSISVDGYYKLTVTMRADSAITDGPSQTAAFANGWLTEMIKARLHTQQSGPD